MGQATEIDTSAAAVLARYLKPAITDPAQLQAAVDTLLEHALAQGTATVAWARGARTYEAGVYPDRKSAQKEAGSAPVSYFLNFSTRYVTEAELPAQSTAREDATAVLRHLLVPAVTDPAQLSAAVDTLLAKHLGTQPRLGSWTIGWGSGPAGQEYGNGPYPVAARFSNGQALARKVDVRTRHFHEDD